uniref:SPK domain-containing protein n=1 Tax=Haemonchus placei TaxID=6290 RepID=A0A0N4WQZ2_HAEPC
LTEEEKATIEKGIEEIAEKFRNGESAPDVKELFKKIHLTDKEISAIIAAAKRRNVNNFNSVRKYPRTGKAPVKKIKKNIYLQPDSVYERADFEPYETEDERIMIMTESLCHAVRKYDHYEWCNRYTEDRIRPESVAATFASNLLNVRCVDVAARLRHCEQFPIDLTLPPTFSTASAYRVFESSRVSLSKRASVYFNPSDVNSTDFMILYPEGDIVRKFTVHDRLNIQLHSDILLDLNYLKLKTQVRAVFLEPTRLAMAIESPEAEEQRNKVQMELMGTIMAEHEASQTEAMLDYVASEVVVENTQENEPIFYEDAVDDALNATIHTIGDAVSPSIEAGLECASTTAERDIQESETLLEAKAEPVKRKRGRPRKYEAPPTSKENQEKSGAKKRKSVHEVSDEGEEEL